MIEVRLVLRPVVGAVSLNERDAVQTGSLSERDMELDGLRRQQYDLMKLHVVGLRREAPASQSGAGSPASDKDAAWRTAPQISCADCGGVWSPAGFLP